MSYSDLTSTDPYFDDFDSSKNYHRILFKPGFAVQARELTQAQTILQNQVTNFADNIFKQNSPVTGGQVTTNFNCFYIKLQATYLNKTIDVTQFNGLLVTDATGTVSARVIAVATPTGGDAPTLVVTYLSGVQFTDNAVIYDTASNLAAQAIASGSTGTSSVASGTQTISTITGTGGDTMPTGPGLIPVATTEIGNITTHYGNQVAVLNSYFSSMGAQVIQENNLQNLAQINFSTLLPNSKPSIYSLVYSLPTYGQQTEQGGQAQFWEGVADLTTFTGEALVGALREGRNRSYLNNAGITTNSAIPADPNPPLPQANLLPSTYSSQQAANIVVK